MYSEIARILRRCKGITKDGKPYKVWAVWDDPRQLCMTHVVPAPHGEAAESLC